MSKKKVPRNSTVSQTLIDNVASVGTFRPKFNPREGRVFSDELTIFGSAFWASGDRVLVTCAHVVSGLISTPVEQTGILVIGYKKNFYRVSIGIVDFQHDLATLAVIDQIDPESKESITGLKISSKYRHASTKVAWAGYPLGNILLNELHHPTYNEGVVGIEKRTEDTVKQIQFSGTVIGGYSGSPIIDLETQEILAVVSNGHQNTGIFMGISFEHVKALIDLKTS